MTTSRNKLYALLLTACSAGYIWLYYHIANAISEKKTVEVCLVKYITGVPCPSCGTTRSVSSLTEGNFIEAMLINPLGYIVAIIMLVTPVWIIVDLILRRETFLHFFRKVEVELRKPYYAIPLMLLVIMNWIWGIAKGL